MPLRMWLQVTCGDMHACVQCATLTCMHQGQVWVWCTTLLLAYK
jgi:hypothetical protein